MIKVEMVRESAERTASYGILFKSASVYRTAHSCFPTRVVVWDNSRRPNARNGEPVRFGDYGPIDGGNGRYLDPHNRATDSEYSILLSTESIGIDAYGTGTGTRASGQVWADKILKDGDVLTLTYPKGTTETVTAHFLRFRNGHGFCK